MGSKGWDYLDHMIMTCQEMEICLDGIQTVENFISDIKTRRAVVMCLLDLGELLKSIPATERDIFPENSCKNIIGFRDRAAHGYHTMDFTIVYALAVKLAPMVYAVLIEKQSDV